VLRCIKRKPGWHGNFHYATVCIGRAVPGVTRIPCLGERRHSGVVESQDAILADMARIVSAET
jgi:hypothetical protein